MPHKDRAVRLAYLRAWKLRHRSAPVSAPQPDPSLPPLGVMVYSVDGAKVQCHACGNWYGSLNSHLRLHELDAASYKAIYDLPRTASLLPPVVRARYRAATVARDQGEVGRDYLPATPGRPAGTANRLGTRIKASTQRVGIYTRVRTRPTDD